MNIATAERRYAAEAEDEYQAQLDRADRINAAYEWQFNETVTEHEMLKDSSAFEFEYDTNTDVLREVWRILRSRPVTENDEAIADIRLELNKVITGYAANRADAAAAAEEQL